MAVYLLLEPLSMRTNALQIIALRSILAGWLLSTISLSVIAADWAGFRGSDGNGITSVAKPPLHWNATTGVRWSVDLPRGGNGSPIVVGNRVLVTSAEDDEGHERSLYCFDAESGEILWRQTVTIDRQMPTHKTNPYAGTTPASDGKVVVVWHGSAGLHAYGMDGQPLWQADLGEYRHMWGYGSSPIIDGQRVILNTGPGKQVFVLAFDLQTGRELWRHEEPLAGDGERNLAGNYMGSWSTPVIIDQAGARVAVCAMATRVCGFDIASGHLLWYCEGLAGPKGDLAYSSPMIERDLCVVTGGFQGPAIGFRLPNTIEASSTINLTDQYRLWRNERNPQSIGTGLLLDGYVYRPGAGPNVMECLRGDSGEVVWQERVDAKAFWGSIVFDGRHAYVTNQAGTTIVFQPSPEGYREVASNPLGDTCNATPALTDHAIFIRTFGKLWCLTTGP